MLTGKDLEKGLKKAHLYYTTDKRPGLMRQKIGKNFKYYDSDGKKIASPVSLNRIKNLMIPPAWENVWICDSPKGHLQATGYDEKGRKQYIYHLGWIKLCQENKFNKMLDFGKVLPKIRTRVKKDMALSGLPRKKIVATIVWLLEHTFIRVGNDEYAKENDSFGLTTLRNKHVEVKGSNINLEFVGKSGVHHSVDIHHPKVAKIIKSCIELPGFELFKYLDDKKERHTIDSQDVNDYLKEITGIEVTAKDFRTWGATLLSAQIISKKGPFDKKTFNKTSQEVVKEVCSHLRNTPAVCRNYYIHPTIFMAYQKNVLISHFSQKSKKLSPNFSQEEHLVVTLLKKYSTA